MPGAFIRGDVRLQPTHPCIIPRRQLGAQPRRVIPTVVSGPARRDAPLSINFQVFFFESHRDKLVPQNEYKTEVPVIL